jgi:hypothetical protein
MAVLDATGQWTAFEMNLGDREQRAASSSGRGPERCKASLIRSHSCPVLRNNSARHHSVVAARQQTNGTTDTA